MRSQLKGKQTSPHYKTLEYNQGKCDEQPSHALLRAQKPDHKDSKQPGCNGDDPLSVREQQQYYRNCKPQIRQAIGFSDGISMLCCHFKPPFLYQYSTKDLILHQESFMIIFEIFDISQFSG